MEKEGEVTGFQLESEDAGNPYRYCPSCGGTPSAPLAAGRPPVFCTPACRVNKYRTFKQFVGGDPVERILRRAHGVVLARLLAVCVKDEREREHYMRAKGAKNRMNNLEFRANWLATHLLAGGDGPGNQTEMDRSNALLKMTALPKIAWRKRRRR